MGSGGLGQVMKPNDRCPRSRLDAVGTGYDPIKSMCARQVSIKQYAADEDCLSYRHRRANRFSCFPGGDCCGYGSERKSPAAHHTKSLQDELHRLNRRT